MCPAMSIGGLHMKNISVNANTLVNNVKIVVKCKLLCNRISVTFQRSRDLLPREDKKEKFGTRVPGKQ